VSVEARYCTECGTPLGNRCGMCGAGYPSGARFCPSCGSRVSGPLRHALQRIRGRWDANVESPQALSSEEDRPPASGVAEVGLYPAQPDYASLTEKHDAESVKVSVDQLLRLLATVVESYGGTVDKFIGDNIMAVFGAPLAHEDDTERALRAALAMREQVAEFNRRQNDDAFRFDIRIGINSGEVVAGKLGGESEAEYTVIGDAVNVAARLQQAARPGEILVGSEARELCSPLLQFSKPRKIAAKGKSQPVVAFALEAVLGPPGTVGREVEKARGIHSPFIGREEELQAVRILARVSADLKRAYLITVLGEPGIGKTRLIEEATAALEKEGFVALWGRTLPYGSTSRLYPLVEMARMLCGIEEGDTLEEARQKVTRTTSVIFGSAPTPSAGLQRRILEAMGLEESDQEEPTRDVAAPLIALFQAAAEKFPLILVFDDLHWADDELLDVIDRATKDSASGSLVVCAIARPELLDRRPSWGGGKRQSHITEIGSLSDEVAAQLTRELFAPSVVSEEVIELVVQRAGGNPLFISELVAYLKTHGLRRARSGALELDEASTEALPLTLRSVIGARLDALRPDLRDLVQIASVVGDRFSLGALSAVSGLDEAELHQALGELEDEGLVVKEGSSVDSRAKDYRFKHGSVRETAYRLLPRSSRSRLHSRVGEWLESEWEPAHLEDLAGEGVELAEQASYDPAAEEIAYHYEEAAKLAGPGEQERARRRAFDFLVKSAHRASGMTLYREAEKLYRRAHDLMPPTATSLEGLAWAMFSLGELKDAEEVVRSATELARSEGDSASEARCLLTLAHIYQRKGDLRRGVELTEKAGAIWERDGQPGGIVKAEITRAELLVLGGDPRRGIESALEAARKAKEVGSGYLESTALQLAGVGHYLVGEPVEARRKLEDSLMLASAAGSIPAVGGAIVALGLLDYWEGCFEDVATTAENLMKLAHEAGELRGEAFAAGLAGAAYSEMGEVRKAIRLCEQTLELSARLQDRLAQALGAVYLGRAEASLGHVKDAEQTLLDAYMYARSSGNTPLAGGALVFLAEILVQTGRLDEAALRLREAALMFEDAQAPGSPWRLEMLRAAANLAEESGDSDAAQEIRMAALRGLSDGYEERAIVFRPLLLEYARALIKSGGVDEAEAAIEEASRLPTQDVHSEVLETITRGELAAFRGDSKDAESLLQAAFSRACRSENVFLVKLSGSALQELHESCGDDEKASDVAEVMHRAIDQIEALEARV
jgi:class 3 adenylate cyclase/tetratricopeptide (TPR) repeat protein